MGRRDCRYTFSCQSSQFVTPDRVRPRSDYVAENTILRPSAIPCDPDQSSSPPSTQRRGSLPSPHSPHHRLTTVYVQVRLSEKPCPSRPRTPHTKWAACGCRRKLSRCPHPTSTWVHVWALRLPEGEIVAARRSVREGLSRSVGASRP